MPLVLYNTLSNKKEEFKSIKPNEVGMYVCGVTVYDSCHLGHARAYVAFDVLARYLLHSGYKLNYVRNITDIDDKIIARANENNESCESLVNKTISQMHQDFDALGLLEPNVEPRATQNIDGMIKMIEDLIKSEHAYVGENGDVFFRVRSFDDYGGLSNKNIEDLIAGARIEKDEAKEEPHDFVLWKQAKPGEPSWKSPWGEGRPGWHIECSVMSKNSLGDSFDIHGGGPDLIFPHHENEIAQSECANKVKFVNYWVHSGLLKIQGEKMSKSLGNFALIKDLINDYHPEVIRFFLQSSHYRSELSFDDDSLANAKAGLTRMYQALETTDLAGDSADISQEIRAFQNSMDDDLNTPQVFGNMFEIVRKINSSSEESEKARLRFALVSIGQTLGLLKANPEDFMRYGASIDETFIQEKILARNTARLEKDFAKADAIRDELLGLGIMLDDSSDGTIWKKI